MRALRPLSVALLTGAVCLGAVPLAHAAFRDAGTTQSTFAAASLAPPTGLAVSRTCSALTGASFSASWTPSPTSWSSAQRVELRSAAGVVLDAEDLGPAQRSAVLTVGLLALAPSYVVAVQARYGTWSSTPLTASAPGC